jgi:hypothetical protein
VPECRQSGAGVVSARSRFDEISEIRILFHAQRRRRRVAVEGYLFELPVRLLAVIAFLHHFGLAHEVLKNHYTLA